MKLRDDDELRELLRALTALDFPHSFRPSLGGRPASVLILCARRETRDSIEILITRRTENVETHKGQYALPGGMRDEEDLSDQATALRETEEEMGIRPSDIEVMGALPSLWTPTGFHVTPVVGLLRVPLEKVAVVPNPEEIDIWFWCPVDQLRDKKNYRVEARSFTHEGKEVTVPVDVYQINDHRIWGVTGAMLKNFLGRLEAVEKRLPG